MSNKVLVVDDERDMLKIVEIHLVDKGFEVSTARSGHEALRKLEDENPDVILMDVVLPDMDGYEVCEMIKSRDESKKIIIYTGKVDAIDAIKARRVGADDFVAKTSDLEHIVTSIKKLLA